MKLVDKVPAILRKTEANTNASTDPHRDPQVTGSPRIPGDPQVLWDPRVPGDPQTTTRLTFGGGLMCATLLTGLSRQPNHHQANLRRWAYVRYAT